MQIKSITIKTKLKYNYYFDCKLISYCKTSKYCCKSSSEHVCQSDLKPINNIFGRNFPIPHAFNNAVLPSSNDIPSTCI